jgi:putative tricarboxylic transport membrane protein
MGDASDDLPQASRRARLVVALLVLVASGLIAWGASALPSESGYQGVGPNFLPWVVALALGVCGAGLLLVALRDRSPDAPPLPKSWLGFAFLSAGMLLNAALIQHIGFILSCALCFALAARGWRVAEDKPRGLPTLVIDTLVGAAISAPVFWLFTRGLNVSLPALVAGGWI